MHSSHFRIAKKTGKSCHAARDLLPGTASGPQ